jgi:regulator of replication initiation timing
VSGEKFTIEIDTSKVTNTLLELRVDAYTKALWQYKLSLTQKRIIKQAVIDLIKRFSEIREPEGVSNVNITINAVIPNTQEVKQNDIELLTKELDVTKRKLGLCEEEIKVLRLENKKVKDYEDKLKVYEDKLKQIEKQIALWKQGTIPDSKQVINSIIKILSQA